MLKFLRCRRFSNWKSKDIIPDRFQPELEQPAVQGQERCGLDGGGRSPWWPEASTERQLSFSRNISEIMQFLNWLARGLYSGSQTVLFLDVDCSKKKEFLDPFDH